MDNIFDRAHDLVDKAQEKVASAASQAAWAANQARLLHMERCRNDVPVFGSPMCR